MRKVKKTRLNRWVCFGQMGHWAEWTENALTKRAVLKQSITKLKYYGGGYLRDCETGNEWVLMLKGRKWKAEPFVSGLKTSELWQ